MVKQLLKGQGLLGDIVGVIETVGSYSSGETGSANTITVSNIVREQGAASNLPFKLSSNNDVIETFYTIKLVVVAVVVAVVAVVVAVKVAQEMLVI